jgi:hypothetical protein
MKANVQPSCEKQSLITYYADGDVKISLPYILSPQGILRKGMMLILFKAREETIVKLLSVNNSQEKVYLKVKDMKTKQIYCIDQSIDPEQTLISWWLTSYTFLTGSASQIEDGVIGQLKGTEPLEFEF